jgi:vesicle-associated membrane protein 72
MSMLYSFVARGSIILAKYASCQGNFEQVALDCLEKLSGTESRFTVKAQEHMLHFLVDGGITFLLIAEEGCSREICFYYLEQVCFSLLFSVVQQFTIDAAHDVRCL